MNMLTGVPAVLDSATIATLSHQPEPPTSAEIAALERLIRIAQSDTGESRRVADFLLAWWNCGECGGFDLTILWALDTDITHDMILVFSLIARIATYPDNLGYAKEFEAIVRQWRPELIS